MRGKGEGEGFFSFGLSTFIRNMDVFLTIKKNKLNFLLKICLIIVSLSHKKIKFFDFEQACAVLTVGLLMVKTAYA